MGKNRGKCAPGSKIAWLLLGALPGLGALSVMIPAAQATDFMVPERLLGAEAPLLAPRRFQIEFPIDYNTGASQLLELSARTQGATPPLTTLVTRSVADSPRVSNQVASLLPGPGARELLAYNRFEKSFSVKSVDGAGIETLLARFQNETWDFDVLHSADIDGDNEKEILGYRHPNGTLTALKYDRRAGTLREVLLGQPVGDGFTAIAAGRFSDNPREIQIVLYSSLFGTLKFFELQQRELRLRASLNGILANQEKMVVGRFGPDANRDALLFQNGDMGRLAIYEVDATFRVRQRSRANLSPIAYPLAVVGRFASNQPEASRVLIYSPDDGSAWIYGPSGANRALARERTFALPSKLHELLLLPLPAVSARPQPIVSVGAGKAAPPQTTPLSWLYTYSRNVTLRMNSVCLGASNAASGDTSFCRSTLDHPDYNLPRAFQALNQAYLGIGIQFEHDRLLTLRDDRISTIPNKRKDLCPAPSPRPFGGPVILPGNGDLPQIPTPFPFPSRSPSPPPAQQADCWTQAEFDDYVDTRRRMEGYSGWFGNPGCVRCVEQAAGGASCQWGAPEAGFSSCDTIATGGCRASCPPFPTLEGNLTSTGEFNLSMPAPRERIVQFIKRTGGTASSSNPRGGYLQMTDGSIKDVGMGPHEMGHYFNNGHTHITSNPPMTPRTAEQRAVVGYDVSDLLHQDYYEHLAYGRENPGLDVSAPDPLPGNCDDEIGLILTNTGTCLHAHQGDGCWSAASACGNCVIAKSAGCAERWSAACVALALDASAPDSCGRTACAYASIRRFTPIQTNPSSYGYDACRSAKTSRYTDYQSWRARDWLFTSRPGLLPRQAILPR